MTHGEIELKIFWILKPPGHRTMKSPFLGFQFKELFNFVHDPLVRGYQKYF